ncbi:alpha/beta fold hydrolase [Spirochaeta africana]|uniref:AB hydrolase-1 domain-containing protein n=1 Tax=Spirochaeta africana (strain ATCC 700263 / DSM 8902 / Z-7692) TaxID=889378 RepID=H9UHE3_SPIAZ|nr:alpha/beta hydrolase [Spirochaeta africana]AFG36936.1 hypothetical protein Spiaf_0844 [Spirochaeta africana DSM 8902]
MKKPVKWFLIGLPVLVVLGIGGIILSSYASHRSLVAQEKGEYPAPGTLVQINGGELHVYAAGEAPADTTTATEAATLVFLSGLGTVAPVYDFQPLYRRLTDDYRIAVVERAGYGYSEVTDSPRDLETVLHETRSALQQAGEAPPYVLLPHSLAGLEALYWAAEYPHEIDSIIGLDPLIPEYHEYETRPPGFPAPIIFLARTGLMRNQPDVFQENFAAAPLLSPADAAAAEAIFHRRLFSRPMQAEADMIPANVGTLLEQPEPTAGVPFHAFISSRNENEHWAQLIAERSQRSGGQHFLLDADHYIHLDALDKVAEEILALLDG